MKKLPLFIAAATAGLLIYFLFYKQKNSPYQNTDLDSDIRNDPGKRHVTNVFAKAKDYATTDS